MSATRILNLPRLGRKIVKYGSVRWNKTLASVNYAQVIDNLPETRITELSNGFKIATETTDSPTATVGVWIDAGSRYETKENSGVGNFFQHIAFKSTNQKSRQDLEREVQNLGAQFSSYVDRDETAYYAQCLSSDAAKVVDVLGDVLTNTKIDDSVIEQERQLVIKELDELSDSDMRQVTLDYLHVTAYQGTPLEKSAYGRSETLKKLTKSDFELYIRDSFVAPRMVLCGSGNINHDELVKVAEKKFGSVPNTYQGEIPLLKPCRFTASEVRVRDDWVPAAHIAIAVDTCGLDSPDIYPLMIAKTFIGSWNKTSLSSSNTYNTLVSNIYKEKGCHLFDSFHILYRDSGLWGCYFALDKMVIDDFIFNLQNEWMKLCLNITETDLILSKSRLVNQLMMSVGDSQSTCANIGKQVLILGNHLSFDQIEEKIQAVTLKELQDVCMKYIYNRSPAVAGFGPVEGLPDYTRVEAGMYRLRY